MTRYVTLPAPRDVNRYVRPTALRDDVINMCVGAHEIMTLLRGMFSAFCSLFTARRL